MTTNRADLIEPALAARPGRVDHAVEFPLPDAVSREWLLRLYCEASPPIRSAGDRPAADVSGSRSEARGAGRMARLGARGTAPLPQPRSETYAASCLRASRF